MLLQIFLNTDLSCKSIPSGVDELHIHFKHELMWLTHAHIQTHFLCSDMAKNPPTHPHQCNVGTGLVAVCDGEGESKGVGGGCETARRLARCMCVCVFVWAAAVCLPALLTGEKASAISVSVVLPLRLPVFCLSSSSLLSLQKPLPCLPPPPNPHCALFADKKLEYLPYPTR